MFFDKKTQHNRNVKIKPYMFKNTNMDFCYWKPNKIDEEEKEKRKKITREI